MKLYETTFITDSRLPESDIEGEIKRVEDTITSGGGEIVETQRWGVRRLAYEIEKQKQGYYAHFLYRSEPEIPTRLETNFRVNEKIMRFLTVVSEIDLEKLQRSGQAETEETTAAPAQTGTRSATSGEEATTAKTEEQEESEERKTDSAAENKEDETEAEKKE